MEKVEKGFVVDFLSLAKFVCSLHFVQSHSFSVASFNKRHGRRHAQDLDRRAT